MLPHWLRFPIFEHLFWNPIDQNGCMRAYSVSLKYVGCVIRLRPNRFIYYVPFMKEFGRRETLQGAKNAVLDSLLSWKYNTY